VIEFDAITFEDLTVTAGFRTAIESVRNFDWVIFTSANGVRFVFDVVGRIGKDSRIFGGSRIAAIGPKTAESLGRFGIRPDFVPDTFTGVALGRELVRQTDMDGRNVLLLRSAIASADLAEELRRSGAVVSDVPVYMTKTNRNAAQSVVEAIEVGQVDWITFTSSSTVRSFFEQVGPQVVKNSSARIISIGPAASGELRRLGMEACIEASVNTTYGIIESLKDFYRRQK
jgi:uroporphyrinogen III methyltransferase/synthase